MNDIREIYVSSKIFYGLRIFMAVNFLDILFLFPFAQYILLIYKKKIWIIL